MIFKKIMKNKLEPRCNYIIWVVFIVSLVFPITIYSKLSIYNYIDVINFKKVSDENVAISETTLENIEIQEEKTDNIKAIISSHIVKNKIYLILICIDIYIIISVFRLIISFGRYLFYNRKKWNNNIENERIIRILNECKNNLKIKRNIKIVNQDFVKIPSIIGIFNVRILFTKDMFNLSDNELRIIIMHELSHYKRKDIFMNWIIIFIKALYCFNPFINRLLYYMRCDMEAATDALALDKIENVSDIEYCETIIKLAKYNISKNSYVLGFVNKGGKDVLSDRIDAILEREHFKKHNTLMTIFTSFVIVFMILVLYPTSYGNDSNTDFTKLYLKLDNGKIIDVKNESTIKIPTKSEIKFLINNSDNIDKIVYKEYNAESRTFNLRFINTNDSRYFEEKGKYNCECILKCKNGEFIYYVFEVLVE